MTLACLICRIMSGGYISDDNAMSIKCDWPMSRRKMWDGVLGTDRLPERRWHFGTLVDCHFDPRRVGGPWAAAVFCVRRNT
jgi:hypothetical protein